jgi:predicted thioesterase
MDFSTLLKVGETAADEYMVKPENTAAVIGNKDVYVLSTPSMIAFMENTAAHIVIDKIPKEYRVVGTKVNIEHVNSTAVNTKVTVEAQLTAVEGRKLCYNVKAFNEKCILGFGTYEQHIINLEDFLSKI